MTSHNAVLVAALALAACNQAPVAQNEAQPVPATGVGGGQAVTGAAARSASLWNNGQPMPLDIQVPHANGVVLQLTSLQSRATDTVVGVRIINGRDRDIHLNRFPNNRDGYLLLETGERLYLSPPTTNTQLTVPAGQTFEGELVFLGRLPRVNSAIMVLNEGRSGDSQYTETPGFRIDLPLASGAGTAQ